MVTALAPYKRVDLAIRAFNQLRLPLVIVGSGPEEKRLQKLAGPTIRFLGWQGDGVVRGYYAGCRAVIFPGEEDFGIVPLEAMASGKPVIAFGKGGVLETVVPLNPGRRGPAVRLPPTGVFFYDESPEALIEAVRLFERSPAAFDAMAIRKHAEPFDRQLFKDAIYEDIQSSLSKFRSGRC